MKKFRLLSIMAHQDDWEITTAGLWATLRKRGLDYEGLVVSTTDGRSGHQTEKPESLVARRDKEARAAAAAVGCRYELLRDDKGESFWNGQLIADNRARGAVWKLVRDYQPDVIFCPPRTDDPRAGCHNDHVNTATIVWSIAYQIQVPHAYPQYAYNNEARECPLIVAAYDGYLLGSGYDVAVDISDGYDKKIATLDCHRSQFYEWLPWVGRYPAPKDRAALAKEYLRRHLDLNKRLGVRSSRPHEFFYLTRWGRSATREDLKTFFPGARLSATAKRMIQR